MENKVKLIPWRPLRSATYLLVGKEKLRSLHSDDFPKCLIEPFTGTQVSNETKFLYEKTTHDVLYGPQHSTSTLVHIRTPISFNTANDIVFLKYNNNVYYVLTNSSMHYPQIEVKIVFVDVTNSSEIDRKEEDKSCVYIYVNSDKEIANVWSSKQLCSDLSIELLERQNGQLIPLKFQTYIVYRFQEYNPTKKSSILFSSIYKNTNAILSACKNNSYSFSREEPNETDDILKIVQILLSYKYVESGCYTRDQPMIYMKKINNVGMLKIEISSLINCKDSGSVSDSDPESKYESYIRKRKKIRIIDEDKYM